jgi:hypothetical protein
MPVSGAQISHQNTPITSRLKSSIPKQNEISGSISYRKHIWVVEMISEHRIWPSKEQLLQQHGHHSSTPTVHGKLKQYAVFLPSLRGKTYS